MENNQDADIEKRRNRGGVADIGTKEDGSIVETINIYERLITVKEKSIYELVLADTLDPRRERPGLPSSIHTKILDRGADDPLVARMFLTAKALFDYKHYPATIDVRQGLLDVLDVVKELIAMQEAIGEYYLEHEKACKAYEERKGVPGFMLPSIPDMVTRCKTIFQKADQACQYLMKVIRLFYPEAPAKKYYKGFEKTVKEKYGEDDTFSRFLGQVVPFIVEIKNARNSFDHRNDELQVTGFELQEGGVLEPTIEMDFDGSVVPRQDLRAYLSKTMDHLVDVIEVMLPYLADKHIEPMGLISLEVRQVPEEKRRWKLVKFGLWWPFGEGGFYAQ